MGTNHVGVFYDGIELGNAQNGTVDLGRFSLDNMESVTLYNGQKSAISKRSQISGRQDLSICNDVPLNLKGEKRHNVKAAFKTGSFGLVNPSFLWEHRLSQNVSSSLSAEYMYTTGKYKFTYRVKNG